MPCMPSFLVPIQALIIPCHLHRCRHLRWAASTPGPEAIPWSSTTPQEAQGARSPLYLPRGLRIRFLALSGVALPSKRGAGEVSRSTAAASSPSSRIKPRSSVWCLVGNGGMDPHTSPYIIPNNSLHNPFPHSLLRTRQPTIRTLNPYGITV